MSSFDHFLDQIGRYPLLTPSEEIELARHVQAWMPLRNLDKLDKAQQRIAKRGRRAYDRFYTGNLRLVVFISKKFAAKTYHLSIDDLTQEGCIGLARAIEKFDPERGYKFSTYSYWWIRQAIMRAIEIQDRMIRLPVTAVQSLAKIKRFAADHLRDHGMLPTHQQCIEHADLSPGFYQSYMMHAGDCWSLDAKVSNEDDRSDLGELIPDVTMDVAADIELESLKNSLAEWLSTLNDSDRKYISMRYGLSGKPALSYAQLSSLRQTSRDACRKHELKCLEKLQAQARSVIPADSWRAPQIGSTVA